MFGNTDKIDRFIPVLAKIPLSCRFFIRGFPPNENAAKSPLKSYRVYTSPFDLMRRFLIPQTPS
jgi:hypothetical protein